MCLLLFFHHYYSCLIALLLPSLLFYTTNYMIMISELQCQSTVHVINKQHTDNKLSKELGLKQQAHILCHYILSKHSQYHNHVYDEHKPLEDGLKMTTRSFILSNTLILTLNIHPKRRNNVITYGVKSTREVPLCACYQIQWIKALLEHYTSAKNLN